MIPRAACDHKLETTVGMVKYKKVIKDNILIHWQAKRILINLY